MAVINPHTSMTFHEPSSKDMNNYKQLGSRQEKTMLLKKYMSEWAGQQIHVVNVTSGEVRLWEMRLDQRGNPTRHARTNVMHLLFGNWRVATAEDIARQTAKDRILADQAARLEANKAATKAGIMFSELTKASKAIQEFQDLTEKQKEQESAAEEKKEKAKK